MLILKLPEIPALENGYKFEEIFTKWNKGHCSYTNDTYHCNPIEGMKNINGFIENRLQMVVVVKALAIKQTETEYIEIMSDYDFESGTWGKWYKV